MNILIVEDEHDLGTILCDYLRAEHFSPTLIGDGEIALHRILSESWDLILLDIMLPGKDGISLCKRVRHMSSVPIIMVTAKAEEADRLIGLEIGADDYICKPFSPREVVARIKAVLRRTQPSSHNTYKTLFLDKTTLCAHAYDKKTELTFIEFRILETLLINNKKIVSRDTLQKNAYTDHRIVSDRTTDSHIKKLRKKLLHIIDKEIIFSVYGAGYRLDID